MNLEKSRLKFVDGLRGIAILMVVFYHLYYLQFPRNESGNFLHQVTNLAHLGKMGVYVFFVISGFIISYITFNKVTNWNFIGKFILKRQIRLDPPFWIAVLAGVLIAYFSVLVLNNQGYLPVTTDVITNLTYTFDITGHYDIIRVGWTLCIEIQFYLVFILLTFFIYKFSVGKLWSGILYYILFVGSIVCLGLWGHEGDKYIVNHWFVFFLGISVTLYIKNQLESKFYFLTLLTPFVFLTIFPSINPVIVVFASFTSLSLSLAFKIKKENSWLSSRFFQYFGMISYSLYLTHCLVGNRIIRFLMVNTRWEAGKPLLTFAIVMCGFVMSCLIATVFYYFIEKSSINWSKRLVMQKS